MTSLDLEFVSRGQYNKYVYSSITDNWQHEINSEDRDRQDYDKSM